MKIGIVSDSHDRLPTLTWALAHLREQDVKTVLHCGDIESPATLDAFHGLDAHFVYGNCDHDREGLRDAVAALGAVLHEPFGQLELAGRQLAFVHGDDFVLLRDLERSEQFDYLFHGHTHQVKDERRGPTRIINPGALHRAKPKTFAILDLATGQLETVEVP